MSSKKKTYYHYTDQKGAEGIAESKEIKASTNTTNDAVFGPGVYLTRMDPSNGPKKILDNNYDDGPGLQNNPKMAAKVEYVAAVKLDRNEVEKVSNDRDVWVYKDGDLDLKKHEHKIQKTPNTKNRFAYT